MRPNRPTLRIPVLRVSVGLLSEGGEQQAAVIFLKAGDRMPTLFTEKSLFVPLEVEGRVRMVLRESIMAVSVPVPKVGSLPEAGSNTGWRDVTVVLRGGHRLMGKLEAAAGARTSDLINADAPSFTLLVGETIYEISKQHVEHVEDALA